MTAVNEELTRIIRDFPTLCRNRTQALVAVFCRTDMGYRWVSGVPVQQHPVAVVEPIPWPDWLGELLKDGGPVTDLPAFVDLHKFYSELFAEPINIQEQAGELATVPGPLALPPAPQAESLLATIPDDVTPEWLDAAESIADVVGPLWAEGEHLTPDVLAALRVYLVSEEEDILRETARRAARAIKARIAYLRSNPASFSGGLTTERQGA